MLTSFFNKSKPINILFVLVYMVIFYGIADFWEINDPAFGSILKEFGVLLVFLLSMLLLNFISENNELTRRNAYKIILFAAFSCMLFEIPRNNDILIANFFVLLSFRRVISLNSQRETEQKIFDATLWVLVASLFQFWSVLFLILVYFGVYLYARQQVKSWFVPLVAFLTIASILTSGALLFQDSFFTFSEWFQESNFDFSAYAKPGILVPVSFLFALSLWTLFFFISFIPKASGNTQSSLGLILLSLFLAIAVAFFAPTKNSSELLFLLAPLSIIVTTYLERLEDKWFGEVILFLIILMPVVTLFLF